MLHAPGATGSLLDLFFELAYFISSMTKFASHSFLKTTNIDTGLIRLWDL